VSISVSKTFLLHGVSYWIINLHDLNMTLTTRRFVRSTSLCSRKVGFVLYPRILVGYKQHSCHFFRTFFIYIIKMKDYGIIESVSCCVSF
jgi:hypothetical protein